MRFAGTHRVIFFKFNHNYKHPFSSISHQDIFSGNTAITSHFNRGDVDSARKLFDEMPHRNTVTFNCMISGFAKNNMISDAHNVFLSIEAKNVVSWTAMISGYIRCGDLDEARRLFDRIPFGVKNGVCWDVMLNGYVRNRRIEEARELFCQADCRSLGLCNRMMGCYVEAGMMEDAHELFLGMPRRDVVSWTTMIGCLARAGFMERAREMFDEMSCEKDLRVWTTMIRGYMMNGCVDEACRMFDAMPVRDAVAWNCMVSGFVENGRLDEAVDFHKRMPVRSVVASNSLLCGLVRSGNMADAEAFFAHEMLQNDAVSWNTLISGYQTGEAMSMYIEMLRHGFRPDRATYITVISICEAIALHASVIKSGFLHHTMVESSLMYMYSKCGLIGSATLVFEGMEERDAVAWNTMILANSRHGSAETALGHFASMVEAECEPNNATFLAILTTCAHSGLLKDANKYFRSMQEDWNIAPQPEHFACMVDLLSRSGMLDEAYEFVEALPASLPAYTWEAVLNCCKLHGNLELGELVAQKVLERNPSNVDMYVILSNFYAAKGLWREAANVRHLIKSFDFRKESGTSWATG